MNLDTAKIILTATFDGVTGSREKQLLELMLEASSKKTKGRWLVEDLLTNDFDCENSGYMMSNLATFAYSSNEICTLAKLWEKATTPTPPKAPQVAPRTMTAIERTEAAIASGDCEPTLAYRVYELTTSVGHLQAGADFILVESFNNEADAEISRDERMKHGFAVCVIVH